MKHKWLWIKLFFVAGWLVPKLVMLVVLQGQTTLLYLYLMVAIAVLIIPMYRKAKYCDG
jgi:hypothetical protein